MSKSWKVELDVHMYESISELKSSNAINDLVNKVNVFLKTKDKTTSRNIIVKACKNAVSLLSSKKKETSLSLLTVYLPSNSLESLLDTVVSNASSDDDVSRSDVTLNDSHIDSYNPPSSSSTPSKQSSSSFSSSPSPSPSPSASASAS